MRIGNRKNYTSQKNIKLANKENKQLNLKQLTPNPEKSFKKDTTVLQTNNKYEDMVPKYSKLLIKLPEELKVEENIPKEVKYYEKQILKVIIKSQSDFELSPISKQSFLKNSRRVKVLEFFSNICLKFHLRKKTLFLSTYLFDKYLGSYGTTMLEEQVILAQACLFIAMKYEEIYPPSLKDWGTNPDKIFKMEAKILKALNFKLIFTSAQDYLEIYLSKRPNQTKKQKVLYQSLLELYLYTGQVYSNHPLKTVQMIMDSFRSTIQFENQTHFSDIDHKIKAVILKNEIQWEKLVSMNIQYFDKEQKMMLKEKKKLEQRLKR